jgi:hypothetical protein
MKNRVPKEILSQLIEIGRREKFDEFDSLFELSEKHGWAPLNMGHRSWNPIIRNLPVEDVISLIKALTIGEKTIDKWNCGSVTQVSSIFWNLYERAPHLANDISRWVVENRKWDYMPFGTSAGGATTVDEYNQYWKGVEAKRKFEDEQQLEAKAERLKRDAIKATENLFNAVRRKDEKAVEALLNKGADISKASKEGKSVLSLAEETGNQRIIEMLRNNATDD